MGRPRTLSGDWYPGTIPENVVVDDTAYIETTYSFARYRSQRPAGVQIGRGASTYLGTMFDVGPRGRVVIGAYTLVLGARIVCDAEIEIGDYTLISWNVVLMDTYRVPLDPMERRRELARVPGGGADRLEAAAPAGPILIGRNVWIGFDVCVLPGVTIGEGSIVGARSVVTRNVPPYTIAAGNPARFLRALAKDEGS